MFVGCAPSILRPALAAVAVGSTWNPADKGAAVALSNGNLTATGPAASAESVTRATTSRTSGKWSFRVNPGPSGGFNFSGLANSAETGSVGLSANSIGVMFENGANAFVLGNNIFDQVSNVQKPGYIDVIVDLTARKVWFVTGTVNSFNGGNPSAGTGGYACPSGALFPACSAQNSNYILTLDVSVSRFSGFAAWG